MNTRIVNLTGLQGGTVIAGTDATTPPAGKNFMAILVINNAVIAALTSNLVADTGLVGLTINAGTIIYGRFTSITLTSGKVIAYVE